MADKLFVITDQAVKDGVITQRQGELIKEVSQLIRTELSQVKMSSGKINKKSKLKKAKSKKKNIKKKR